MNDRTEAAVGPSGLSLLSPKIYFFKESEIIFALRASNVMSTSAEVVSVLVFFEAEEAALESARLMRHYLLFLPPERWW